MAVIIPGSLPWSFLCTEHPCPRCLLDRLLQLCSNVTTEMRPTPHAKFNNVNCTPPNALCLSISHSALTSLPPPPAHLLLDYVYHLCFPARLWLGLTGKGSGSFITFLFWGSILCSSEWPWIYCAADDNLTRLSVCPSRLHLLSTEITEYTSTPHSTWCWGLNPGLPAG